MSIREFLQLYRECKRDIVIKERKIQILKEKAKSLEQSTSERVQSSGSSDRRMQIIERYVDLENELATRKAWVGIVQPLVYTAISELTDNRERDVVECRYIDDMSFEETAEALNFSYRWVKRLHIRAISKMKLTPIDPP